MVGRRSCRRVSVTSPSSVGLAAVEFELGAFVEAPRAIRFDAVLRGARDQRTDVGSLTLSPSPTFSVFALSDA